MGKAFKNADVEIDGLSTTLTALESTKPDGDATWQVGTDVEYAVYVEYGTKHMEAQPYLRPALNQTMREADALAEQADDVDELVELIAESVAAKAKDKAPVDTGTLMNSIEAERIN